MSRAVPRPLVGLAATALAAGLLGAPLAAYADPTGTPTPSPSATAAGRTATATPSPSSPSASTSASPSTTGTPESASATPSAEPSETPSVDPSEATPSPSSTASAGRMAADAVQAPAPTASESSADQVQAQAAAGAAISLTKTASPSRVSKVGQVITYRFVASNTGSVPLIDVTITDNLEGLSPLDCTGSDDLAPAQARTCTATLTVTQDWIDFGSVDNSATVFGSYPVAEAPDDYVGANASAHVSVDKKPSIALDASVSPTGTADAGDRLRYEATATNTGNVTLRGARITSSLDKLDLDCDPSARATLAPGESMTCDGSYKVTTSDGRRGKLSNKLTALATGPYDDQGVDDTVTLRTKVTKISSSSDSDPGLADTGGPGDALPIGVLGVVALITGVTLVGRGRRA